MRKSNFEQDENPLWKKTINNEVSTVKRFERLFLFVFFVVVGSGQLSAQTSKPNILVIMGDDVGWMNVASYGGDILGSKPQILIALAGGYSTYILLCPAKLHRWSGCVPYRSTSRSHWIDDSRHSRIAGRFAKRRHHIGGDS
jgi:hypothetical protein